MRSGNRALNAHGAQQALYTLTVDRMALTHQPARHPATAVEGCAQGLLVNQAHVFQVLFGFSPIGHMIIARTAETDQRALRGNAQIGMVGRSEQASTIHRIQPTFF